MGKVIGIADTTKTEKATVGQVIGHVDPQTTAAYLNNKTITSTDANNDGEVNLLDLVRAKKVTANSPSALKEYNTQATKEIGNYIVSPSYNYYSQINDITKKASTENGLTLMDSKRLHNILSEAKSDSQLSQEERDYYTELYNTLISQSRLDANNDNLIDDRDIKAAKDTEKYLKTHQGPNPHATSSEIRNYLNTPKTVEEAKENMERAWRIYQNSDTSLIADTLDYVYSGDTEVFDRGSQEREEYEAAANTYYSIAIGDVEARKKRIEEIDKKVKELEASGKPRIFSKEVQDLLTEKRNIKSSISGYSTVGKYLSSNISAGAVKLFTGISATGEFLFGTPIKAAIQLFGGDPNVISGKEHRDSLNEVFDKQASQSAYAIGDKYNIGGNLMQMAIGQIPNIFLAGAGYLDDAINGVSKIGQNGGKIVTYLKNLSKNPLFWSSFSQTAGNEYEQAVESGANSTVATTYAILSSGINAAIEIGGGIETLPGELRGIGNDKGKLLKWIVSSLEEGGEEVLQNTVSEVLGYIAFDRSKITKGEFDSFVKDTLNQGAMGVLGGGIIGGGQLTFHAIANANTNQQYNQIGEQVISSGYVADVIKYAQSSENQSLRQLANNITSENITPKEAGQLYSYACKEIDTAINSATNMENLNFAFESVVNQAGAENIFVAGVITPQYMQKAEDLNIDTALIVNKISEIYGKAIEQQTNSQLPNNNNGDIINKNIDTVGEDSNGREGILHNSSEWSGREGTDTTPQVRGIQEIDGRVYGNGQEGTGNIRTEQNLSNQGNNRITEPSPEQTESLKTTAIKNDDGTPKTVYHFTDNMDFDTFGKGDIGFHFGGLSQAEQRRENLKKTKKNIGEGRIIKAHLDIKNPVYISTDIMVWQPSQTALWLQTYKIISKEEYAKILQMHTESGGGYDSPAAIELRRILANIGYDGIVYQNNDFFEGEGESYIAFYPEQVIIIDDGKATSDNEAASFMPENSAKESFEGVEDTDAPQQSEIQQSGAENALSDRISLLKTNTERRHTTLKEQKYIKSICDALGREVVFENIAEVLTRQGIEVDINNIPDGYIDENNVIHIGYTVYNPVQFILKHELTHFGEGTEAYTAFIEAVQSSKAYLKWLQKKTGSTSDSLGKLEGLYREAVIKSRDKTAPVGAAKAQAEIFADFCGDMMFTEMGLKSLAKAVEAKHRPKVIQYILDFFAYLKQKLSGNKQFTMEIARLESKYAEMLRSANETSTDNNGEVRYSIDPNFEKIFDEWDKKTIGAQFRVGTTSKVLQNLGIDTKTIYWDTSKIVKIQKKHPDMTDDVIKQVPNILENPIMVMESATVQGRLTLFGEVYDASGAPVLAILELNPTNKKGHALDIFKIASAYGKSSNPQALIDKSKILYTDPNKNRTNSWLTANGLHLPKPSSSIDSTDSITEEKPTVKKNYMQENKKYSIPTDTSALLERYEKGEIEREEYVEKLEELWGKAIERYGSIEQGENAKAPISVPLQVTDNKNTERFIRTVIEKGELTSEMLEDVEEKLLLGDTYSYTVQSDEKAVQKAKEYIDDGTAKDEWSSAINSRAITKTDIAIGESLLMQAIEDNDRLRVLELSSELADAFTRAGQVVQAARLFKKMTGVGMLMTAQRNVKTINKDLEMKYGKGKVMVELDELLAKQLTEAKSMEDIEIVYKNVLQDVAAQVPATFLDKLNAWRYFAMLANPRTHIRNLVSNTIFMPSKVMKDVIATGLEHMLIRDKNKRTKAIFVEQKYKDFAAKDIKSREAKLALQGTGHLDQKSAIQELRRTFETDWLENLTKGNSNLLEREDMWFKSIHYKQALAGFLQARKIDLKNVDENTLRAAREYAVKEAKKATFQDASAIADVLNNIRVPKKYQGDKKFEFAVMVANGVVEGVLPFKRTPINIIKRGVEYSPIGLMKTIADGIYGIVKGDINVSEFCDGFAAGLTGTALCAVGWFLASAGWAIGAFGDDDEDKFKQLNGEQEYSIQIFGKSYSIDWACPAAIPFFIGVELSKEIENDGIQLRDLPDVFWNVLEPITNLSMLSGVQNLIEAVKYEDGSKTVGTMIGEIFKSYAMQFIPTALSATARSVDSKQRTWYNDKNSKYLDSFTQSGINNLKSKIPGLSYTQPPKIDAWGREVSRGSTTERLLENFISPGYYSKIDYNKTEKELKRLYAKTGENVFPKTADKSFEVNGETKYLTAAEYVAYAKAKGQISFDYIHEFMQHSAYEKLSDEQRANIITNLYKYSNAKAKAEVSDYDITKSFKTVAKWEGSGNSAVVYYIARANDD